MSISAAYDDQDATGLADLVARKEVAPDELLDEAMRRAEAANPKLNALTNLVPDAARALISAGLADGPFRGVPFLLKDLGGSARGYPVSSGSRLTAHAMPAVDSEFYLRIKRAGLVTFGRTTSPEFGVGPATESAVYGGPTRNPYDLSRTSGGSSGGAGAAVAARILPAAHATDGAGSIRIPAASCGLVGFKATRGRTPNGPMAGEGWAGLSIGGFVTRTVRDTAALLDCVCGPDLGDPYAAPEPPMTFAEAARRESPKLRIGYLTTSLTGDPIHPDNRAAVEETAKLLASLGHEVFEAPLPDADTPAVMRAIVDIIACGSALSVREALKARGRDLQQGDIEAVTEGAIRHAQGISGADYLAAVNVVHAYGRALARYLTTMDVLLTATLAEPPAKTGRFAHTNPDFVDYRLGPKGVAAYSPFTAAFNASGQPAVSLPLHWNAEGLPIGVHLAAPFGDDVRLMTLSADLERARPWADRRPPAENLR